MHKYVSYLSLSSLLFSIHTWATVLAPIQVKEDPLQSTSFLGVEADLKKTPLSVQTVSAKQISENNMRRLTDVALLDASMTESYSGVGYWDSISLRGYKLDPRTSYLRDGLPISGETAIALENKQSIEILKGFGGLGSGANVPGGLINYQTKKALGSGLSLLETTANGEGGFKIHGDVDRKISPSLNLRTNLAYEQLRPGLNDTNGERTLTAIAITWAASSDLVFESEIEWSKQSQPTQAGFSLLGDVLPSVSRLNLNNQSWTKPVEFQGMTRSLKVTKSFSNTQNIMAYAGFQTLETQDRLAYPFGCSAENAYDRFCSDGTFDLYDYRSEGEKRERFFAKVAHQSQWQYSAFNQNMELGLLYVQAKETAQKQAYNLVGQGNINGMVQLPANPATLDQGTLRDYSATDLYITNQLMWQQWKAWFSLRQTFLHRESQRTDSSRFTNYNQAILTPWVALSHESEVVTSYLSYSEGSESFVTPNRASYTNAGQYLTNVRSNQWELGLKAQEHPYALAIFSIARPLVYDAAPIYQVDGEALHQGLEVQAGHTLQAWHLDISAMYLHARQQGRTVAGNNGERPVNVPGVTLRTHLDYDITPEVFSVGGVWIYESDRTVLADGSLKIPAWHRFDLKGSYKGKFTKQDWQLQARIENVFDAKFWKEAPTQYGHIYLYPSAPRQVWLSFLMAL